MGSSEDFGCRNVLIHPFDKASLKRVSSKGALWKIWGGAMMSWGGNNPNNRDPALSMLTNIISILLNLASIRNEIGSGCFP